MITVLLPVTATELSHAIAGLKIHKLLAGYRNSPAVDVSVLIETLDKLVKLVSAADNDIVELEINPLFVYENKTCAVDALLTIAG